MACSRLNFTLRCWKNVESSFHILLILAAKEGVLAVLK
jgi:hypothetical protein